METIQEEWKTITEFPKYEVSSFGRIKNKINQNILNGGLDANGYIRVSLSNDYKRTTKKIHCLMGIEFFQYTFNAKSSVINHIDGNKENNNIDNLEVTSQRTNTSLRKNKYTSSYTGVNFHKATNKWISQIYIDGKNKYLGIFDTEIDAHNRYTEELNKITI